MYILLYDGNMINTVTATEARNNFFTLAEKVKRTGQPIRVIKHSELLVEISPIKADPKKEWKKMKKALDKAWGMWADRTEEEIRGPFREATRLTMERIRARDREYAKSRR